MSLWKPTGRHWAALGIVVTLAALGAAPAPASDGVLACGGTNTWLSGGSNGNRSYTVYRFAMEFVRGDAGGRHFGPLTFSQATSLAIFVPVLVLLLSRRLKFYRGQKRFFTRTT